MRIKKNGQVITLTESDLNRIVKKVLNEQENCQKPNEKQYCDNVGVKTGTLLISGGKAYLTYKGENGCPDKCLMTAENRKNLKGEWKNGSKVEI